MQNKVARRLTRIDVRPHNRRLLLQLLRLSGEMSRAELASQSGLSPAAVTNVVSDLIDSDLVVERSAPPVVAGTTRLGRPGSLVTLATESRTVMGVQIGAGVLQTGICDLGARLIASEVERFALDSTPDQVLNRAVNMLHRTLARSGHAMSDVIGIGVGAAGLVDRDQRINLRSPNLGWSNVAMADYFEAALGKPTVVDHNVRAMAMGEAAYGIGRGLESLAFIYIRTGVGAGLVLGGSEYRGGTHGAVEFGHIRVVPGGELCTCGGRGCLETVASDRIIRARALAAGLFAVEAEGEDPGAWVRLLREAIESGVPAAIAIRDDMVEHVASALLSVINLLNPQMIVLGGLLYDLSDVIIEPLRSVIPPQVLPVIQDGIRLNPASFGADAGLIGAGTVALDHFVFGAPLVLHEKAG